MSLLARMLVLQLLGREAGGNFVVSTCRGDMLHKLSLKLVTLHTITLELSD